MEGNGRSDIRDRLLEDLQLLIKDAEDLLKNTGVNVDERYRHARERFESTLGSARENFSVWEERISTGARDAYQTTDRYVKENPWQAVGVGAAVGILAGMLLGRR